MLERRKERKKNRRWCGCSGGVNGEPRTGTGSFKFVLSVNQRMAESSWTKLLALLMSVIFASDEKCTYTYTYGTRYVDHRVER